jgi:NAD(P)-dependent dehydrogenase (short-subunit alcohol dehydrogenase family)
MNPSFTSTLQGKNVLITGAGKGIGRATALAFARAGAHVVLAARTQADLEAVASDIAALSCGARAIVVPCDVSREEDVARLAATARNTLGAIDILVNNAGVGKNGTIETLSTADYDWMMATNMRSTWLCTKAFLPPMLARQSGAVIFVSSVAGLAGLPNEPIYCATKFAQIGFAQSLDYECFPRNVRVSVIAPGGTDTPFGFYNGTRTPGDPRLAGFHAPEDVADAVVFAAAQPPRSRIFMVWMRPMNESLGTGGGADFKASTPS